MEIKETNLPSSDFGPAIVAVGLDKRCVILEGFPDDEKHYGLKEMLEEVQDNSEFDLPAGVYKMYFYIENTNTYNPEYDNVYLELEKSELIYQTNFKELENEKNQK